MILATGAFETPDIRRFQTRRLFVDLANNVCQLHWAAADRSGRDGDDWWSSEINSLRVETV